jgi:hypothetical protein
MQISVQRQHHLRGWNAASQTGTHKRKSADSLPRRVRAVLHDLLPHLQTLPKTNPQQQNKLPAQFALAGYNARFDHGFL